MNSFKRSVRGESLIDAEWYWIGLRVQPTREDQCPLCNGFGNNFCPACLGLGALNEEEQKEIIEGLKNE